MSQEQWYLLDGEDRVGPLSTADLKTRAGDGSLSRDDLVWKYGLEGWTPAATFEYLFSAPAETSHDAPAAASRAAVPPAADVAPDVAGVKTHLARPALRVGAAAIDAAILSVPLSIVMAFCVTWIPDFSTVIEEREGLVQLVLTVIFWVYFATQECAPRQGTPGKRMLGLRVADLQGRPISFARASARHFVRAFFIFGFLLCLVTKRRQALHDMLSGCVVIREPDAS